MTGKVYALPNMPIPSRPVIQYLELCEGCDECVEARPIDVFLPAPLRGSTPIILHPE
jgi:NAD-dependent dihydropyrimidine dehydrogenase PreA subunit